MRIGIDCQALSQKKSSGLGRYTSQLVDCLQEVDKANEYVYLKPFSRFGDRTYDRLAWENLILPVRAHLERLDLLHIPAFAAPYFLKGIRCSVITIHDLIGKIFPEHLSTASRWYWGSWLPFVNSRANCIIVDSECTKQDVVKYLNVEPKKIRVVHLAAGNTFQVDNSKSKITALCQKLNIKQPYIFFVGNLEPRKNLSRVVEAFAKLTHKRKINHQLVIAGTYSWDYHAISRLVRMHDVVEQVKFLDYVDDEELVTLYNGSDLFVFPSLYEGFGIPVLEAMGCGVPVLASKVSSIPEVAGDAAYYVDPYQVDEIESGMIKILSNKSLSDDLRRKGLEQCKRFSWKETARKTLEVYHEFAR